MIAERECRLGGSSYFQRLGLYLRDFNREYLSSAADRRQVKRNLLKAALTVAMFIAAGVVLWAL